MKLFDRISGNLPESWNPVFVKEMRQSLHGSAFLTGFASLLLAEGVLIGIQSSVRTGAEAGEITLMSARSTIEAFHILYCIFYAFAANAAGLSVPLRWSKERATDGISPEFTTPLSPFRIASGKYLAMFALWGIYLLAGLPGFVFSCRMHGVGLPQALTILLLTALPLPVISALAGLPAGLAAKKNAPESMLPLFLFPGLLSGGLLVNALLRKGGGERMMHIPWITFFLLLYGAAAVLTEGFLAAEALASPEPANRGWKLKLGALCFAAGSYPVFLLAGIGENAMRAEGGILLSTGLLCMYLTMFARMDSSRRCAAEGGIRNRLLPDTAPGGWGLGFLCSACGGAILGFHEKYDSAFLPAAVMFVFWFYSGVVLLLRRWFPKRNPASTFLTLLILCNLGPVFLLVNPDAGIAGIFSVFLPAGFPTAREAFRVACIPGFLGLVCAIFSLVPNRKKGVLS